MTASSEFLGLIRAMGWADPSEVPDLLESGAGEFGGTDVVVYLVDFEQRVLEPLRGGSPHEELPQPEGIDTTVAGRAFLQRQAVRAERADGFRVWVPILEGSDPTGVLAVTVPDDGEDTLAKCRDFGVLAGYLLATQGKLTDLYHLHRRRKAMTLPASMQWDLLPPLTLTSPRVVVAGMVEPAYEVGGDCFDYALNGAHLDLAVMDCMGHGLGSAMAAALTIGCYRHHRRGARMLETVHRGLDRTLGEVYEGEAFVTGQVCRLDLHTGVLSWINAGHPRPLLIRRGRVVGPIDAPPTLPWGLGPAAFDVVTTALEPDDRVVFHTDGVVEARGAAARPFGEERLADLVGQHASDRVPAAQSVRLIIHAVLEHHQGDLADDATVVMVHWPGTRPTGAPADAPGT